MLIKMNWIGEINPYIFEELLLDNRYIWIIVYDKFYNYECMVLLTKSICEEWVFQQTELDGVTRLHNLVLNYQTETAVKTGLNHLMSSTFYSDIVCPQTIVANEYGKSVCNPILWTFWEKITTILNPHQNALTITYELLRGLKEKQIFIVGDKYYSIKLAEVWLSKNTIK